MLPLLPLVVINALLSAALILQLPSSIFQELLISHQDYLIQDLRPSLVNIMVFLQIFILSKCSFVLKISVLHVSIIERISIVEISIDF